MRRLRFPLAFAIFCIGLYAIVPALPSSITEPINENTARALAFTLNALGVPVSIACNTVSEGDLAFKIIPECTPIFTAGLFLGFVAFYPATLHRKLTGLLTGLPALYLANLARLVATFLTTRYDRSLFEAAHVYLGQVFTMLTVIAACILWLRWIEEGASEKSVSAKSAGFLARFILISGCVFFVWMKVHPAYIRFVDRFAVFGFSLFGHYFTPVRQTPVYYETFSVVPFTALVLAVRSTPAKTRIVQMAAGLGFLFLTHLFHRIDNFLLALLHYSAAQSLDMTLLIAGQYLLPMLVLIYSIRRSGRETVAGMRQST